MDTCVVAQGHQHLEESIPLRVDAVILAMIGAIINAGVIPYREM